MEVKKQSVGRILYYNNHTKNGELSIQGQVLPFTIDNLSIKEQEEFMIKDFEVSVRYGEDNQMKIQSYITKEDQKDSLTYILLAVFLGGLGIQDFYIGKNNTGWIKLIVSILTIWFFGWVVVWLIGLVEIFTIKGDSKGIPFK